MAVNGRFAISRWDDILLNPDKQQQVKAFNDLTGLSSRTILQPMSIFASLLPDIETAVCSAPIRSNLARPRLNSAQVDLEWNARDMVE